MHFSVVIPVYNGKGKIERTLDSILGQEAFFDRGGSVEVLVIDGASPDGTAGIARGYGDPRITVLSEPDSGMYDALVKGLQRATGEITCYMPAGDEFHSHAFGVVMDVFAMLPEAAWLTGRSTKRNALGQIFDSKLPQPFHRGLFRCGAYGTTFIPLMQEATFWRTRLHALVDMDRLRALKLAGDFFLWWSYAAAEDLWVVNSVLGMFTFEEGQLSKQTPGAYEAEIRSIATPPTLLDRWRIMTTRRPQRRHIPKYSVPRMVYWDIGAGGWAVSGPKTKKGR